MGTLPVGHSPLRTLFNLPNSLTSARVVLAFVLFGLIAYEQWLACLVVFALAAATDWLDGLAARRLGLVSSLGRTYDPLADKVMTCGAFIFLLPLGAGDGQGWLQP